MPYFTNIALCLSPDRVAEAHYKLVMPACSVEYEGLDWLCCWGFLLIRTEVLSCVSSFSLCFSGLLCRAQNRHPDITIRHHWRQGKKKTATWQERMNRFYYRLVRLDQKREGLMAEFLSVSANISEVDLQLVEVGCMLQRRKPDEPPGLEQICGHWVKACCRQLPGVLSQLYSRHTWVCSSKMKMRIEQTDKKCQNFSVRSAASSANPWQNIWSHHFGSPQSPAQCQKEFYWSFYWVQQETFHWMIIYEKKHVFVILPLVTPKGMTVDLLNSRRFISIATTAHGLLELSPLL